MAAKDDVHEVATRFQAKGYTGWRSRLLELNPDFHGDIDKLKHISDVVYGIVLETGADISTICAYFGWVTDDAKPIIAPIIEMAQAELKLAIQKNQLDFALASKQPLAKIHIGRHFAGQTEHGVQATGDTAHQDGLFNNLTVVETHRDEGGNTVAEPSSLRLVKNS